MGNSLVQEETRRAVLMLLGERGRGKRGKGGEGRRGRRCVASRRMVRWCRRVLRVLRVRKKRYWAGRGRVVIVRVAGVVGWIEEEREEEVVVRGEEVEGESGGLAFSTRAQVR